jgi:HlyD family secretion protein
MTTSNHRLPTSTMTRDSWLRKWLARIPPVLVFAAALYAFYHLPHGVTLGSATFRGFAESISINVGPIQPGRVESIEVAVGKHVKTGDVIARMSTGLLQAKRDRAQAELERSQATVEAELRDQDAAVTRAELLVLRTRTNERENRAELEQLSTQMKRLDGLASQRMIPVIEAEDRARAQRALAARVQAYNSAIQQGKAGLDGHGKRVDSHDEAVQALVAPSRIAVRAQQAVLQEIDIQVDECTVRSPADGIVSLVVHQKGEVIPSGEPIVTIVTGRPGVIVASVPERIASSLAPGDPATLRRRLLMSPAMHGKVLEVSPEVDESPVRARPSPGIPVWGRRVAIQLDKPEKLLHGEGFHVRF